MLSIFLRKVRFGLVLLLFSNSGLAQGGTCNGMTVGPGENLNGFDPFPANNAWNTDISNYPVHPNSTNYINFIGATASLHPDFLSGTYHGKPIGIPYQIVAGSQGKVNINFTAFGDESDPGPYPIPGDAPVEGGSKSNGDRHVLVLEKDGCWLYELYRAFKLKNGSWNADSAAVWDMTINEQRPYTWTSADAAGLPIFPGLVRYDEVASGVINHAIRFTVPTSQRAFILPATHWASTTTDPNAPPMGLHLRLKASFNITGFPADDQVILTALKTYGIILADNGSAMFISGAPDSHWNNADLDLLKTVKASDFEAIDTGPVVTPADVPTGSNPTISSFTATPTTVNAGNPVTLDWSVSNATYNIISPQVGAVRGTSVVVTPAATTTYTLYSTNQYGRSTQTVTVTVQ
jgi:hypothetical protein